jgi:6-phosphofructokinase 1
MARVNAFYAQSGGVTAVINATACGVIETARKHRNRIANVYAGRHGIIGALTEDMIDTNRETAATIAALQHTPGGAFGSARYKLRGIEENRAQYERLIEVFKAHDIGYFFYNGGNDSMDTAHKVSLISKRLSFPVTCIGIPKTVDNDLPVTDNCPGFGSVAKYVAVSTREAALDVLSMAKTSTKVFILEVMGRHAGWIAAAGGLAGTEPGDAPHIILFPEIPFRKAAFLKRVKESVQKYDYCVVVVSEGAQYANGEFLAEAGTKDAFGHSQLGGVASVVANMVRERLGYKYHYAVADYLQRSARHIASKVDVDQCLRRPLPVAHREVVAGTGRQQGEDGAAPIHYQGRIRHHAGMPTIPGAAHQGRELSPVRQRLTEVRDSQKRPGTAQARLKICGMMRRACRGWGPVHTARARRLQRGRITPGRTCRFAVAQ